MNNFFLFTENNRGGKAMYDNRNKIIILLLILALIFSLFTIFISSEEKMSLSARSAALYEPETKRFIYTKNENQRLGMASTTKIMTAILALEALEPNKKICVDSRATGIEGSSIYLKPGETMNAIDLIYSVLLQSANDAAAALAYEIAGGIEAFAEMMNEKARSLGLCNTHFTNPHGLDDKEHYTTAHDLSIIAAEALENKTFKEISSTYKKQVESSETVRTLVNHNKMLKMYDGCVGLKTGFTKKCGRCLVSAAERDNLTMISVTIDAPNDWQDHTKMLDYGFSLYEARFLAIPGEFKYEIPVLNGTSSCVQISNSEEIKKIFAINDSDFQTHIKLSRYFPAPINKGDILGVVIFTKDGEMIASVNLLAESSVDTVQKKKGFFNLFK